MSSEDGAVRSSSVHGSAGLGRPAEAELHRARAVAGEGDAADASSEDIENPSHVRGRVRGSVPEGAGVRAVLRTLSGGAITERVVGEGGIHIGGWFRLAYERPDDPRMLARTSVVVELVGADGAVVVESAPLLAPRRSVRIDLRPPRSIADEPSEYALLERHVGDHLEGDASLLDGLPEEALSEIAEWVEVEPHRVSLLGRSRALAAETGVPGEVFYALGRAGVPLALEELADVPLHQLGTTVREAVADRIVGAEALEDLEPNLERLAGPGLDRAGAGEAETEDGAGDASPPDVRRAEELGRIVGADPALLRRLHALRREGRWTDVGDLAALDVDAWCALIEEGDPEQAEEGSRVEARANAIVDALEESFPSAFIRRTMLASESLGAGARRVLERAPDHDLVRHSIQERAAADAGLLEGLAEGEAAEALEEIASIERVARVTPRAEHVAVLVGTGLRSAHAIGATPRRHFIEVYAEALGGRDVASGVHAQAQQAAASTMLSWVRLLQSLQHQPRVLRGDAPTRAPELGELFGALSSCACEHCSSVYSPAAYFVDLMRYLDLRNHDRLEEVRAKLEARRRPLEPGQIERITRQRPLDRLLDRRPDLVDIELTCENTFTTLPYIDLVNEVLEARVLGASPAHQTGAVTSDVLRAVPQHTNAEAYRPLRTAVYPATLPFDEPLEVTRAYLGHLGVPRSELVRELARPEQRDAALVAEELGMSPEEVVAVAFPPEQPWMHFGFARDTVGWVEAAGLAPDKVPPPTADASARRPWELFGLAGETVSWIDALARVPSFLRRARVSFQELIDLVGTRFVNAEGKIRLDSTAADCDPEKVRIGGLDAVCLGRMLQLLRLRRRLKWTFADVDRALASMGAADLDLAVLAKLIEVRDLARRLDRPIADLLALWAPLDTLGNERVQTTPAADGSAGDQSAFKKLLQTRAVAWHSREATPFALRADRSELAAAGDTLDAVAPALLAAFRITSEDLAIARAIQARRGSAPRLDRAGLSAVYRVTLLARSLRLRIDQLDALLQIMPPDADPFAPGDPAATRRFVDIAETVAASEFTPEKLLYLFRAVSAPRRDPAPSAAQVDAVLGSIRRGLADAFAETALPAEVDGNVLRAKLATWLDGALVDQAVEVLDPRTQAPPAERRAFFDRHLARIFPDPAAAAARLFGGGSIRSADPPGGPPSPAPQSPAPPLPSPASPLPDPALEQRWRENVQLVLLHLLPLLRARQMRGAVVQALGDVLGTSAPSTARLLETVMRSRVQPGRPMLDDFFALVGSGLTGAYHANGDLTGEPALTRTDPRLEFSWAGAPPAEGVPGAGFSVRWTGRLLARARAVHTFFVRTDGAVRLAVKAGDTERVLLDQPAGAGRVVEHVSQPIALDPAQLCEVRVEYRNGGGPASFSLQYGTSPSSKLPLATPQLYPAGRAGGLTSFEPIASAYRRLHKAAMLITGFGITDAQLEWLTREPRYLDLDALPMAAEEAGAGGVARFHRWRQVAAFFALRKRLPRSDTDLGKALRATSLAEAIEALAAATGWDRSVVAAFVGTGGFGIAVEQLRLPLEPGSESLLFKLDRAVALQRRLGVAPETMIAWANKAPDADTAEAIVGAVKARYDEKRWLEVAQALNDPLRVARRDALVAYLLPRMREQGIESRTQLFEYFLIDVDMSPCMSTSRIKQAISAVQTFVQRCLMKLEAGVSPRLIDENDWRWLKSYRVWEANRKIFLYPENWIEPELRDDKSPIFKELERTILQQEINADNVESAFIDYLQDLDEVARLDVRAVWYEPRAAQRSTAARQGDAPRPAPPPRPPSARWDGLTYRSSWDDGTYHVFARTYGTPHEWFYRRLEKGRTWTPWEKIDADIEGDHLVPVVYQRRVYLFWTIFRETNKPAREPDKDAVPYTLGKDYEIGIAYSVYDRGHWSRKRMSSETVTDDMTVFFPLAFQLETAKRAVQKEKAPAPRIEGSAWLPRSAYTLRATVSDASDELHVYLYRRSFDMLAVANASSSTAPAESLLLPDAVVLVATFGLDGSNGALDARSLGPTSYVNLRTSKGRSLRGALGMSRRPAAPTFAPTTGGRLDVPAGYRIDTTGFASRRSGATTLSLSPGPGQGFAQVLRRVVSRGTRLLPVVHPEAPPDGGLSPFFFQDRRRTFFVRPVAAAIGAKWLPIARPLLRSRAVAAPSPVPRLAPPASPARAPRPGAPRSRGRSREDVESAERVGARPPMAALSVDEEREDLEDAAWHPDDAAPRPARQRRRPPLASRKQGRGAPAPAAPRGPGVPAPAMIQVRQPAHYEWRLRFIAFEHPATSRLIRELKAGGVEKLLDLATTRPAVTGDHFRDEKGKWRPAAQGSFARRYAPGPLADGAHPDLDIDFDADNPYALYNWELFFHAPLQVAVRLAKDGRHEEAQRWFHHIFDPTSDTVRQGPTRYWNFAPFQENEEYDGARELIALLSYDGSAGAGAHDAARQAAIVRRQYKVRDQVTAWWEKPFSPHVIARLRTAAYQKAVVMKYIDNLIEWGDKLFRRDTMESIQEATQIYVLAANILGPRAERVPPMVKPAAVTFRRVRDKLDLFANWAVKFENSQVRAPFRVHATPDVGGVTSVLGMATQYFCVPPNPQLDKYWDTVDDRLSKIRNCMNITGVVRSLALFEPPIDPAMLVRATAAGADLGSVIADLNAPPPHHRFRVHLARAVALAADVRRFGEATLAALERRDAEALASIKGSHETALLEAVRDIARTRIRQVEEELAALALEREQIDLQIQHVALLAQTLMNPQEAARQQSLTAGQVIADVAEGVQLVSKVLYAIPEFQAGAAGGFSSPFTTIQLGGQMLGSISSAFAESLSNVMARHSNEAELAEAQAEYQRRQQELLHEQEILVKEKEQVTKHIGEINLKLQIQNAELRRHDVAVENSRKVEAHLREKFTNEQLYGWMLGQVSGVYFQAYKLAFDCAKMAERSMQFERGEPSAEHIRFSYWDSLRKGLGAGESLLVDLRRMEAAYLAGDARALEVTRHVSLRDDAPAALEELLATGRCKLDVTEALLDGDFPGHYFRRIKTVSLSMPGPERPHAPHVNVNCTLTLLGNRIRTDANASGSYPASEDGEDTRFLVNIAPLQAIATSRPGADPGVFELRFDDDRYLPFEGAGAISSWRIELRQADNALDLAELTDVVLSLSYSARSGGALLESAARASREKGMARGGMDPPPRHRVSLRRDLPEAWKRIGDAAAGHDVDVDLPITPERLSGRYRGLAVRLEGVAIHAHARAGEVGEVGEGALHLKIEPPKGSGAQVSAWARPWPGGRTLRAVPEVSGPPGRWKLSIGTKDANAKIADLFDDIVLLFDVRARLA